MHNSVIGPPLNSFFLSEESESIAQHYYHKDTKAVRKTRASLFSNFVVLSGYLKLGAIG
jgi:hypothetical protein